MNKCGSNIIKIYGISQDPKTKNYIIVLQYAEGGNFNDWINKCYKHFDWNNKLRTLTNIIIGLNEIHQKQMVHRDFHTGNILFEYGYVNQYNDTYISDMGLCGEIGNVDKSKIYGVMPYVAPEVLRGKPYTKAADIYSFGMIMYFVATGRQPFSDHAHDKVLALGICSGIRPKLNELEAPNCYVELMERCWDSVPDNRPNAIEIIDIIYSYNLGLNGEINKQFKEAEEYRKVNISSIEINQSTTHPQASNISRLLNPFTKDLPKCDNNDDHSECLDCSIAD
ncbi:kinase-like domain-containing protein [Rhizophagus irregularis DAOM 181602=DAOM 197198]|nr:kinase-like domain-containing protein [Rhizophagus irregularis DAOM 181602=DAOM 197198]POG64936.1 kinase-like domain-containing protein [Rhizophagus irregularis DAOM 181602=DAOM 197198]|eukprot:XP_025171802.1 kinase-like domain-containing protein [Rhizophagus irregularis DAOM 181602=DAOM 197198]